MTCNQVARWHAAAAEQFGDPSVPITQLFVRWQDDMRSTNGYDLVIGMLEGELALDLGPQFQPLPMQIRLGEPEVNAAGELVTFGAQRITGGVWALGPSLNVEGLIHGFVVLYDVPDPAPWERRILLP